MPTFIQLFNFYCIFEKIQSSEEIKIKMYEETDTQVVDTLPKLESLEWDPANEQVCHEKIKEKGIKTIKNIENKGKFSKTFQIRAFSCCRWWNRTLTRLQLLERRRGRRRRPE